MNWRIAKVNNVNGYICIHGMFHPDRKNILLAHDFDQSRCEKQLEHPCDGCCQMEEFPGFINLSNFTKDSNEE